MVEISPLQDVVFVLRLTFFGLSYLSQLFYFNIRVFQHLSESDYSADQLRDGGSSGFLDDSSERDQHLLLRPHHLHPAQALRIKDRRRICPSHYFIIK